MAYLLSSQTKEHRQLPERCQVHGFMEGTLVGGPFAEEGDGYPVLATSGCQGRPAGRGHARANDAAAAELADRIKQVHVATLTATEPSASFCRTSRQSWA